MKRFRKTIRNPETLTKKRKKNPYSQFDKIIDLHGLTSSNAERIIKAIISNYPNQRVLINHGKGEGTLRQLVRKICKNDQRVKAVKNGEESLIPGGEGVTIIQL